MQLTSANLIYELLPVFFKASQQGVQKCLWVNNFDAFESGDPENMEGYAVDSLFIRVDINSPASLMHFDNKGTGFFTTEEEAIECHRQLVVDYINNLNNTTLKSCPINVI